MLSVLFVSALVSGISSRPTSAESLLYKTTCGIVQLLGVQCKTAPDTGQSPSSGFRSGSDKTTTSSNKAAIPSNQPASQQPASPSFTPVNLPDQQLPTITPVSNTESSKMVAPHDFVGYDLLTIRGNDGNSGNAILGATIQAPLQPSAEGWKVFGIAWYWWVVVLALIVILGRLVTKKLRAHRQPATHLVPHS